jgi:hypothetical protein
MSYRIPPDMDERPVVIVGGPSYRPASRVTAAMGRRPRRVGEWRNEAGGP